MGKKLNRKKSRKWSFFFTKFPRYREIECYLYMLARNYPRNVRLETIGQTHQGRDIDMIVITKNRKKRKNGVLIDAGIHAREWLTHTTVLYMVDHLIRDSTLLSYMDFYVIPCLNPDGYEYTHTIDRLWRKNLNPNGSRNRKNHGVDLNRNFPYKYGDANGSSGDPKSIMYRGKYPLSEPETRSLSNVMRKYQGIIKLYISVHSYGNVIMYPWSYTTNHVKDRDILDSCGQAAKLAIYRCRHRWFRVGTAPSQMYIVSGSSTDYATGCHNIKFSYCIELQAFGKSGFQPSPRHIVPIGVETLQGIISMVKYVHKYYKRRKRNRCKKR